MKVSDNFFSSIKKINLSSQLNPDKNHVEVPLDKQSSGWGWEVTFLLGRLFIPTIGVAANPGMVAYPQATLNECCAVPGRSHGQTRALQQELKEKVLTSGIQSCGCCGQELVVWWDRQKLIVEQHFQKHQKSFIPLLWGKGGNAQNNQASQACKNDS